MSTAPTAGLLPLGRLMLRLDRVRIVVWALSMTVLTFAVSNAWSTLYPTEQSRLQFAAALESSPALTGLLGPLYNPVAIGGLTTWRIGSALVLVLGLVNVFIVVRHTRAEEAAGRTDLVRSAPVGRASPTLVAFSAAAAVDLLFAVSAAIVLVALDQEVAGACAFALSVAGGALVFAAIGILAAQAVPTSRTANGLGSLAIAGLFMAYAVGNATPGLDWLAMATPFGWASRAHPFAGENWWLVTVPFVAVVVLLAVGLLIGMRRDVGASVVPARAGRLHGARWLRSTTGLSWRIDRGQLATWVLSMLLLGAFVGYLAKTASNLLRDNPQLARFLDRLGGSSGVTDSYVLVMIGVLSFSSAAYAVAGMLRTHADEESGRLELLLTAPVPRVRVIVSRLLLVAGGVVAIQLSIGVSVGLSNGLANGNLDGLLARYTAVALLPVPAVWVLVGVTAAVVGALPRYPWLAWTGLAYCVAIGELGTILGLPDWTQRATPFWFTPKWPVQDVGLTPLLALTGLSLILAVIGVLAFRRRDIPG